MSVCDMKMGAKLKISMPGRLLTSMEIQQIFVSATLHEVRTCKHA